MRSSEEPTQESGSRVAGAARDKEGSRASGEFDPGSERTLAACVTHASRMRHVASVRWRMADG